MKSIYYFLPLIVLFINSCTHSTEKKAIISEAQMPAEETNVRMLIEPQLSAVKWHRYETTGSEHFGTLKIKGGEFYIEENKVKSGELILDMNSFVCEDIIDENMNSLLIEQLKSPIFFDVEQYPEGKFIITHVEELSELEDSLNVRVSGNLELKGIAKNITFNAMVKKEGTQVKLCTETFSMDRSKWGINKNKNIVKDLKNSLVSDNIVLYMEVVANPS